MTLVVVVSFSTVYAQETTPAYTAEATEAPPQVAPEATSETTPSMEATSVVAPGGMVTCDADLILALYVAERFFDFSTFADQLPSDMRMDIDNFDKGQFEPLFVLEARAADTDALQMSDEMRDHMMEMMAMSDAEFEEHMGSDMMPEVAESGTDVSTPHNAIASRRY
jgi:hypothetical protein